MTWQPDYTTTDVLKNYINLKHDDADDFLELWVTAASRNVDDFCHRQFGNVAAEARTYTGKWDRHLCTYVYDIDDLMDLTGFSVVDVHGTAVTSYSFEPVNNLAKGKPYEQLHSTAGPKLTPTAPWGWTSIPRSVTLGLLLQGARLAARRNSPFGVAGSPTDGSEIRLLAKLDPDLITTLKPLQRQWWAR